MKKYLTLRRKRDELGVVAIIAALLAVVLLMFAAYAVDIGMQVNRKHQLNDTLDAAAQAGAFELPDSSITARAKALEFALAHDPSETGSLAPNVDFWCVVASKLTSGTYQPNPIQIPQTCYPGTGPYTFNPSPGDNYKSTGREIACSEVLCAIPCVEPTPNTGTPKFRCNTIRVFQGRSVPFGFAPAGGIQQGSTGNIISVACKGSCGTVAPNPMDVAIVADRTGSMSDADLAAMKSGITGMLTQMTPSQQYVSFGTIGRASAASTPASEPGASCPSSPSGDYNTGAWLPVPFSNNYHNAAGTGTNANSGLVKAITCLAKSSTGTTLAAPAKAAARYLLGLSGSANNLGSLPARQDPVSKVLIFETDGQPNESPASGGSTSLSDPSGIYSSNDHYTETGPVTTGPVATGPVQTNKSRNTTGPNATWNDIYRTTTNTTTITRTRTPDGGQIACANFVAVASAAKSATPPIKVITVGYNLDPGGVPTLCSDSNVDPPLPAPTTVDSSIVIDSITPAGAVTLVGGKPTLKTTYKGVATINQHIDRTVTKYVQGSLASNDVKSTLAAAASPTSDGVASAANNNCSTAAGRTTENADGDFFFCAASGTDMASIFITGLSQVAKGIRLIKMP